MDLCFYLIKEFFTQNLSLYLYYITVLKTEVTSENQHSKENKKKEASSQAASMGTYIPQFYKHHPHRHPQVSKTKKQRYSNYDNKMSKSYIKSGDGIP
jgi:hypothetical protein